jgi:hypothetical protein
LYTEYFKSEFTFDEALQIRDKLRRAHSSVDMVRVT